MNKIIYLDAAASALKTDALIAAEVDFLRYKYANAGRGICARVTAVDDMVAQTRTDVAAFINAAADENIVFTGGTTDAMNRIARLIDYSLGTDKTIMVSDLDHHSARLPFECILGRVNHRNNIRIFLARRRNQTCHILGHAENVGHRSYYKYIRIRQI